MVGRTKEDIKKLTATSRSNVRKAQKEKRATNRFNREGLDQSNIKKKVKKFTWKYKRGDKIRAERRFFMGTELSNKVRIGQVQQTNS